MFGNFFKKKYPKSLLVAGPGRIVFTLPAQFANHDPVSNSCFSDKEQRALYKLFCTGGRDVGFASWQERSETEFFFIAEYCRYGEVFWSDQDDLTSTMYGTGPGNFVINPKGMIEVREFEFFCHH